MKRILRSLVASVVACTTAHAALDLNSDSVPDVWAAVYNTGVMTMTADTDGDGFTNAQEAVAGTDPRSPSGTIKITSVTNDVYGVHLLFATQPGKRYQVQSATSLTSPVWANEGNAIPGVDGTYTADVGAAAGTNKFYRIVVSDTDSDGDGVSDWEEIKLGFDPNNTHSGGAGGQDDLLAITAALTAPSLVTATSVDSLATEPANGVAATDTAAFIVSRTGGLRAITVSYTTVGSAAQSGTDYTALTGSVTLGLGVRAISVPVVPLADTVVESPEAVILNVAAGAGYTAGVPATAGVVINDRVTANGNGLRAQFFNEANTLNPDAAIPPGVPPTFANQIVTRIDPVIDYDWIGTVQGTGSPAAGVNVDYFASRWTGEVLPEFSQIYTFSLEQNRAGRLWVNGKLLINKWPGSGDTGYQSGTYTATIELQAGVRYPIVLEHFETTGDAEMHVRWTSANQALEIIPTARLFADTAPQITGVLDFLLIQGSGPFSYQIAASGNPTNYTALNLPPGWTVNNSTGMISGSPTAAGEWYAPLTASNANGSGSAILHIKVLATGGAITRDLWTGVAGTAVSAIPLTTTPTSTGNITSLEGPQNAADNYGARIRGYVTAPTTGTYKFFLAASSAAELWIADDDELVNAFKRAQVTTAVAYRDWASASAGKSPLLWLEAGRRYFVEVRHKAGTGNDHVSVGWIKPGEGGDNPGSFVPATGADVVVPGFVLSPYVPPAPISGESTLFVTNMSAQGAAQTNGYGSATLRLSADETHAILSYSYANLTTPVVSQHIHADGYPTTSNIIFDIDDAEPAQDGSYTWPIEPTATISVAAIIDVIKTGRAYINIHTATYPSGEIRGNFRLAAASQTFTPPAPVTWTDPNIASSPESHLNDNAAARFLVQATFGVSGIDANANGTPDEIDGVKALGFNGWIDDQSNQASKPISYHYPYVFTHRDQSGSGSTYSGDLTFSAWWKNSVSGPDQLRQRVAFALSEILVVSESGPLDDRADALSDYYDMLLENAFGNFKDVLIATTLHPAMGRYLDMLGNNKPNLTTGRIPNENYAREILQLFGVGLNRLHPDGSLILNSKGELIPTYDQDAIIGFAHAFTGWYYHSDQVNPFPASANATANWIDPMTEVPSRHFTGPKRLLNNVIIPGLPVLNGQPLNPYATHNTTQVEMPEYQALSALELEATHDAIFQHPNVGPFICRQLIQRLVTSTPSRGYLYRVVTVFNDNGSGVRGDLKAVIKAILLDYEARSAIAASSQGFGKQREPVSRIAAIARAFPPPAPAVGTYSQAGSAVTITTSTPHLYTGTPSVYVDFGPATSGTAGQPSDANYTVTVVDATNFTLLTKSRRAAVPYTQSGGIVTFTDSVDGFSFATGDSIFAEYLTGSPLPASVSDTIDFRSSDSENIIIASPNTKRGTYTQSGTSGTTVTLTVTGHGYAVGASLRLDFVSINNSAALPASGLYSVVAVPTVNTFTVAVADTNVSRNGTVFATPAANVLPTVSGTANLSRAEDYGIRSGPVAVTYSDWNVSTTDTDLNQTPLRSPTVFNFFLPDYQFPGILGNAGLITPEFELTSETSVIRQANTIYNGLFSGTLGTSGLESFKSGGRDLVMDLRPLINGTNNGQPWAHNNNIVPLIDRLNTRLMGGQLPAAARTLIDTYIKTLPYTTTGAGPTADQLRTRIRSTIHLIVTSPDFTIQK